MLAMDGGTPGMWNQLRFNVDQPPSVANLVSHVTSRRPGPVVVGPAPAQTFAFVDPETLAIAQRLARRDVAKLRESQEPERTEEPVERAVSPSQSRSAPRSQNRRERSVSPSPVRPVARPCRRERERQAQQEARQKQRERDLQQQRALPPARSRPRPLRNAAVALTSLPARGESPPMRDTDPQPNYPVASKPGLPRPRPEQQQQQQQQQLAQARSEMREIRAQHQQMLAALRDLAKTQHLARDSPVPSDRSQASGRPRTRLQTRRTKLWGGPAPSTQTNRAATKATRQPPTMPASRRPGEAPWKAKKEKFLDEEAEHEEAEEEEDAVVPFRGPRLLNEAAPSRPLNAPRRGSAEEVLEEVRRLLLQTRAAAEPQEDGRAAQRRAAEAADLLLEEEDGEPGPDFPSLDEMAHRLEQIEADADAIRDRWRTLQFEEVEEESSVVPLESRPLLFTKTALPSSEGKKVPRPPTTVPLSITHSTVRSIESARQRYLDWNSDRSLPRFSVELPRIADWIADDLVDEIVLQCVTDIDRAGEEIVQLLLEGEMSADHSDSGKDDEAEDEDEEEASDFDAYEEEH